LERAGYNGEYRRSADDLPHCGGRSIGRYEQIDQLLRSHRLDGEGLEPSRERHLEVMLAVVAGHAIRVS
jgi:hypothetical protein